VSKSFCPRQSACLSQKCCSLPHHYASPNTKGEKWRNWLERGRGALTFGRLSEHIYVDSCQQHVARCASGSEQANVMLPWVEHCLWARARGQARCRLLLSHALAVRGRSGRHTGVFPMTKWRQTAVGEGCVHKQIRAHWFGPLFGSHTASLSASASAVASVAGHWVPAKRATTPEPPEAEPRSRTSTCLSLHGDTWNLLLHALHPAVLQRPHLRRSSLRGRTFGQNIGRGSGLDAQLKSADLRRLVVPRKQCVYVAYSTALLAATSR